MAWGQITLPARLELIAQYVADILNAEASSIFLLQPSGTMRLEAAYGHLPGTRKVGRAYPIRSGAGQGLISHIAHTRTTFRAYGEELQKQWASDGAAPGQLPSGERCSMLVLHLWRQVDDEKQWVGLIRVENKLGQDKRPHSSLDFTDEDVRILSIFVEAVVEAIENVILIDELKVQKDHWARLVASSPNGIVAVDKDGAITEFNDKAAELLGYTKEEILQRPIDTLYYDEGQARVIGQELYRQQGRLTKFLTSMRSQKGENIPIYLSATWLYDAAGKRIGNVGYFETLHDVKKLDERLALLSRFTHTIAQSENTIDGLQAFAKLLMRVLPHSFCRLLLADERRWAIRVEAAHLVSPQETQKETAPWEPRLQQRLSLTECEEMGILSQVRCTPSSRQKRAIIKIERHRS